MATYDFSKYTLYKWRYLIGYALIGFLLASLLLFAGFFLPGGLSQDEMASVVQSSALSVQDPGTFGITDLPYHALQAAVINTLGASILSIKLPSLVLALFSAIGLILLLRRWFRPSIAVLGSLIAVSNSHFLFIAQSGTPDIMAIFWPVALLLLGTQVTRVRRFRFMWKALFSLTAALSLYTPFSIYVLLAIALAVILHPHLRNIVRRLSNVRLSIVSVLFIAFLIPLAYFVNQNLSLALNLLGIPTVWPPELADSFHRIITQYFLFWKPGTDVMVAPVFGLGSVILILFGLYRLIRTRQTTRSYLIIIWFICLVPVLILSPQNTAVTFVPSVLMLTAGLQTLIAYWYRLFPRNPYARFAGLIPIVILVVASIVLGVSRYAYSYHYSPTIVPQFSRDIALLPADTTQLKVSEAERPFWSAVTRYKGTIELTDTPTSKYYVVTKDAHTESVPGYTIYRIITNSLLRESDRLYVYQKTVN